MDSVINIMPNGIKFINNSNNSDGIDGSLIITVMNNGPTNAADDIMINNGPIVLRFDSI